MPPMSGAPRTIQTMLPNPVRLLPHAAFVLLLAACAPAQPLPTATLPPVVPSSTPVPSATPPIPSPEPSPVPANSPAPAEPEMFRGLALHPDGRTLALATTQRVRIYDLNTLQLQRALELGFNPQRVAWSPDGLQLAVGGIIAVETRPGVGIITPTVQVWDASMWQAGLQWFPDTGDVSSLSWSSDGTQIAVGGFSVEIYDAQTGQTAESQVDFAGSLRAVWSPDGTRLAAAPDLYQGIRLWRVGGGSAIRLFDERIGTTGGVAWSPDGKLIASASHDELDQPVIGVWDTDTKSVRQIVDGLPGRVANLAWSPDGARLAAWGDVLVEWDAHDWGELLTLGENTLFWDAAWTPDSARLLTVEDHTVRVWDAASGAQMGAITVKSGE